MYEKRTDKILVQEKFLKRISINFLIAGTIIFLSLSLGILGYHLTEKLSWTDSLLNASMILGGMGPVDVLKTEAGKIFASFYALFSGIVFLVVAGIIFAPAVHRLLHKFHFVEEFKN